MQYILFYKKIRLDLQNIKWLINHLKKKNSNNFLFCLKK